MKNKRIKKMRWGAGICMLGISLFLGGCSGSTIDTKGNASLKKLGKEAGIIVEGCFDNTEGLCNLKNNFAHNLSGCKFDVKDLRGVDVGEIKKLQLSIFNKLTININVQYKINWFDVWGMEIDPDKACWKSIELCAKETKSIAAASSNNKAKSFRIYVRDIQYKKFLN